MEIKDTKFNMDDLVLQKDVSNIAQNLSNKENQYQNMKAEDIVANVETQIQQPNFKDEFNTFLKQNEFMSFIFDFDFGGNYNFETATITKKDAEFFLDLIEYNKDEIKETDKTPLNFFIIKEIQNNSKTETMNEVQASSKIMDILQTCVNTKKPVRIDFDNNITLVLKVDNEGKIMAHFYPNDKVAEEYLKNNIQSLKQKFDEENIVYSYLNWSNQKRDNNKERQQK